MHGRLLHPLAGVVAAAAVGLLIGALSISSLPMAVALVLAPVGMAALSAPTAAWVGGAVAAVILIRVPTAVGVLPDAAVQIPIVMAWFALALAILRNRGLEEAAGKLTLRIALFLVAVAAATIAGGSEPLRPLLYVSLIVTPFALLATILLDPPDPLWRKRLLGLLIGLALVQVPFAFAQTYLYGSGDFVRGTLVDSLIGAHQVAAIAVVAAIWLALNGPHTRTSWTLVFLLSVVPLLAAANQVIFAIPFAVVGALLAAQGTRRIPAVFAIAGTVLALLLLPGWNSDYARYTLGQIGASVKAEPAEAIAAEMSDDGRVLIFGQGPATTVSGAGFLTTEANPLIAGLGLEPADFPTELESTAAAGSIQRPVSSFLGIAGDLGLFGLVAYLTLFLFVFNRTRKHVTPLGQAATAGLLVLVVLGYFNDALEQPAFALYVAALVGLTLTAEGTRPVQRRTL